MSVVVITGSTGLIGSEAVEFYVKKGCQVVGIDNDMRKVFFGEEGSTSWNKERLQKLFGTNYTHHDVDIRDYEKISNITRHYGNTIKLIIHTAAQPSHDWAANAPHIDFGVNANGTLNMLEAMREHCPEAVFIYTSTNKVYGDQPNRLPLVEQELRWEIDEHHRFKDGITEEMSIDDSMHSLFGASKLAGDILVQEYGRYFGFKTYALRGGVLSGGKQSGVKLHGFLNYLMKCNMTSTPYTIIGYKGKQVRDVIHSSDVLSMMDEIFRHPLPGGFVFNLGGGRKSNISILEAIEESQKITGKKMIYSYTDNPRQGDHQWYVSNMDKFKKYYPNWQQKYSTKEIMEEIYITNNGKWY